MTSTRREKCTEDIRIHLGDRLKHDLRDLAAASGHDSLSGFIRHVLREYAYGKLSPYRDLLSVNVRDE